MDAELSLIRTIGRILPPVPHATAIINRVLKPMYLRKSRPSIIADVWGLRMLLDPAEAVDGGMLFYPQLYNRQEFRWLDDHLLPTDVFVDVGAYIGAFSLRAARIAKKVIAIEANPETFARLTENIRLNGFEIEALNIGVSDRSETLTLHVQERRNAGGSSFVNDHGGRSVKVPCHPLAAVAPCADVMKIDVEGMEAKVLAPYLNACRPRAIILEAFGETDALKLCLSHGYRLAERSEENVLLLT